MSDFDREAERERLREQFEADKQQREQSEQMSELLLKGATMTNVHCDRCGDPIFRWDGQEFCPTCQGGPGGEPADTNVDAAAHQSDTATDEQTQQRADTANVDNESGDEDPTGDSAGPRTQPAAHTYESTTRQPRRDPTAGATAADTDVTAARASLAQTLATLSRRAEQADDLSVTREYLTAAKEAAEALEAAERVQS